MANAQITTGVTVINSLKGFIGLSLTNFSTSAVSSIASGSVVEVAGAFFNFSSDETINASSWTAIATGATAYLALTPSGTAGSQILSASWQSEIPVWSITKQGWYSSAASNIRLIGGAYKLSNTSQLDKYILSSFTSSAGKLHLFGADYSLIGSSRTVYVGALASAGSFSTAISVINAGVPYLAKAVLANFKIIANNAGAGSGIMSYSVSTNNTSTGESILNFYSYAGVSSIYGGTLNQVIPISTSGTFYVKTLALTNTNTQYGYIDILGYYLGE